MLVTSRKIIDKYIVHEKDSIIYREARNECDITIDYINLYTYVYIFIIYILIIEI